MNRWNPYRDRRHHSGKSTLLTRVGDRLELLPPNHRDRALADRAPDGTVFGFASF